MSRFVIYLEDDSQDRSLALVLRRSGLTISVCGEEKMNGADDADQLRFAAERGYVLYTSNVRDFEILHRQYQDAGESHAGLIYHVRHRYSVGEQARRIGRLWEAISAEEMVNHTESLSQWGEDRPA